MDVCRGVDYLLEAVALLEYQAEDFKPLEKRRSVALRLGLPEDGQALSRFELCDKLLIEARRAFSMDL